MCAGLSGREGGRAHSPSPGDRPGARGLTPASLRWLEERLSLETECGGASAEGYCLCVSGLGGGLGWRGERFLAFS